jgi:predicted nucleic acid-binding protein
MIVIADTSPINFLVQIGEIEVLPKLYDSILIPPSVRNELRHPRAPDAVRQWIHQPPEWLQVRASSLTPDSGLLEADIDVGERDAILLALEVAADEVIMDDMGGRREAERLRLSVTGTIGVLRAAAKVGLLDLHDALDRLLQTNFRIDKEFLHRLIRDEQV